MLKILKSPVTGKSVFTRMCISEAILLLMQTTRFEDLKISTIVKRAGVSRMTFYKYYASPYEALTDYLKIIIDKYTEEDHAVNHTAAFFEYDHILFALQFFDHYSSYFLTLVRNNLHSILLDSINEYMTERIQSNDPLQVYQLISYSGGLLNTFLKWEESGKIHSAEQVADIICKSYHFVGK